MLGNHLLGLYEKALPASMSFEERLKTAKKAGFDFVEISIDETDERLARLYWSYEQKLELLTIIKESGISMNSMCLSGHRRFPFGSCESKTREKAYEIMQLAIEFASFMGIRVIQLAGYDVYYEESTKQSREAFEEGLRWACDMAAKHEIMLAMEIMDTPFLNSITKNLAYEEILHSPWYKVYPDIGNLTAWNNDVVAELEKGIDSIVSVHLKETKKVTETFAGKFKCVEFGTGDVDFVSAFEALENLSYKGPFLIEMWTDENVDDKQAILTAKQFLTDKYNEAMKRIKSED